MPGGDLRAQHKLRLLDHLIGKREQPVGHLKAERLREHQVELAELRT